ncbi:methyltransferase domain-containing protein [Olleya sp. R77988]|uniref:methyltransferase domain-containing protein n=1 Tax=Olleya sp. R77988 TaxID=3093875 RepID=UPI0037CBF264
MLTKIDLKEYFNNLSGTYRTNEFASFFLTNFMRRKLIKKVQNFENKSVLDIMSGKGENLKYINQNNTKITTIDFASKMNIAAKSKHKNKKIHQIENDFFKEKHKPESYDIILCSFGIKTIQPEQLNAFTKQLSKTLKPNGEIFLLELVKPKRTFNYKFTKFYLDALVPNIFGKQFKALFPYIKNHVNMNKLKLNMINEKLQIIEHKRYMDLFEIIHAKNIAIPSLNKTIE